MLYPKETLISYGSVFGNQVNAEIQAGCHKIMTMTDWIKRLDLFLKFNEKNVLINPGKTSATYLVKELSCLSEASYGLF
jgi:hypothetical protein